MLMMRTMRKVNKKEFDNKKDVMKDLEASEQSYESAKQKTLSTIVSHCH